jgi:hypothetical protein
VSEKIYAAAASRGGGEGGEGDVWEAHGQMQRMLMGEGWRAEMEVEVEDGGWMVVSEWTSPY